MVSRSSLLHGSGDAQSERLSIEEKARRCRVYEHIDDIYAEWTNEPTMNAVVKQTLKCAYRLSGTYPAQFGATGAGAVPEPVDMRRLAAMVGQERKVVERTVAALVAVGLLLRQEGRDPVTGHKVVKLAAGRWPTSSEAVTVPTRRTATTPTEEEAHLENLSSDRCDPSDPSDPDVRSLARVGSDHMDHMSHTDHTVTPMARQFSKVAEAITPRSRGKRARHKHGRR